MNKDYINKKVIVIFILFLIIFPILINFMLFADIPKTPSDLGNSDWLTFWGSFIGGCFGGIATLIAVNSTLKQNLNNHEKITNQTSQNHEDILKNLEDKSRLEVLPFINIKPVSDEHRKENHDYPSGYLIWSKDNIEYISGLSKDYHRLNKLDGEVICIRTLAMENIGLHSAINIEIAVFTANSIKIKEYVIPPFHLSINDTIIINLYFIGDNSEEYIIEFKYNNIYRNPYIQKLKMSYSNSEYKKFIAIEGISSPKPNDS
jgi:hypothetical protein